uniref:Secreted protein n=1 Tax=Ascaris lumbricoides TaxID=6252 RepID=A0A0M3IMH6_ASCLU
MTTLNIILLLGLIALIIQFAVLNITHILQNKLDNTGENPCIYEYNNWGRCSGKCWNSSRIEDRPKMIRYVNAKTIVEARGKRFERCPAGLKNHFEEIPCNFYKYYVYLFLLYIHILQNKLDNTGENPCIYEYNNWGRCSGKCWNSSRIEDRPKMIRYVNAKTIVEARGKRFERCPAGLKNHFEEIPCNFYKYYVYLFLLYIVGKESGCYRIRNISFDGADRLQLIRIDTHLTEPCNMTDCSDYW